MKYLIKYLLPLLAFWALPQLANAQLSNNADSLRAANQQRQDSMRAAQKVKSDSLAAVRAYKASPQYKDSFAQVKQARLEALAIERTRIMDSVRGVMKRHQDSVFAANKAVMDAARAVNDSIKNVQKQEMERQQAIRKRTSDSMGLIRAYKQSKGYKDSVATVNLQRLERMKAQRLAYTDSVRAAQRSILDSITAERRRYNDSLRNQQKLFNDSVKSERIRVADSMRSYMDSFRTEVARVRDSATAARKIITDSLAKVREERAKDREVAKKEKETKKKLALEIKLDKEKKAFTNESQRKKNWGFPRKLVQNTYTRYNYYFNADLKLKEAELNMQRIKKDSFDALLDLFAFNPDIDSARFKSDMDTIIQKASLGIQLHDPRGKWQDDLYLLMGQAYYYKGDYENAANAFKFIVHQTEKDRKEQMKKNKTDKKEAITQNSFAEIEPEGLKAIIKHTPAKNEAILWLSRVLVKQDNTTMSVLLLDMLKNDVNFPPHLRNRLALEYANLALATHKQDVAVDDLNKILLAKDMDKYTRRRAGYILGQIYQSQNELDKSTQAFEEVVALHPKLDMDFNARMNIVRNNITSENVDEQNYHTLVKMSKDEKFKPYFDQVYYALGKHFEETGATDNAIKNYQKSIENASNNNLQKGLTYIGLGDLYYKNKQHTVAAEKYDSAVQFLSPKDQPIYGHAANRAAILYKVAVPAGVAQQADSLLHLSGLSESERRDYVRKHIKNLEKRALDSYYVSLRVTNAPPPNTMGNTNKSWYFGNPAAMQKGANEFKQKWPNRELKDNWRRSVTSGGFSVTEDNAIATENLTPEEQIKRNLPHEDTLLLAIPTMPQHIDSLKKSREEALYELGKSYFYNLEDYTNTFQSFDRLDSIYPNNRFKPETYYIKYLISMRQQNTPEADKYYKYLTEQYPDANYTLMLTQAMTGGKGDNSLSVDNHYDAAYKLIMSGSYETGLVQVEQAYTTFPMLGSYQKQYDLLRVIGYAGKNDLAKALAFVDEWLKTYPSDSLKTYANTLRDYILRTKVLQDELATRNKQEENKINKAVDDNNKVLNTNDDNTNPDSGNNDPVVNDPNSPATIPNSIFSKPKNSDKHYVILLLPLDNRIQGIKAGLGEYNRITDGNEEIVVTLNTLTQEKSVVLSKEFSDLNKAKAYINKVKTLKSLFQEYPNNTTIDMLPITVDNYGKLLATKDVEEYLKFSKKNYK